MNAYSDLCTASSFLGRPQKAIEYADKAIRLSPRDPLLYVFHLQIGFALSLLRQDEEAIEWLGEEFDPAAFDLEQANKRLGMAFKPAPTKPKKPRKKRK